MDCVYVLDYPHFHHCFRGIAGADRRGAQPWPCVGAWSISRTAGENSIAARCRCGAAWRSIWRWSIGLFAASFGTYGTGAEFSSLARAVAVAAGFVCFFGCIDDAFRLSARAKLALQICSILPIVLVGYYIDSVVAFGYRIEFGYLGIPITVLWLLGCINALNLIDGMDGLASVVGLSTAAMMGVIAASEGHRPRGRHRLGHVRRSGRILRAQSAAGQHLPGRLGQHGHRTDRRRVGNARLAENFRHALDHRAGRGDDACPCSTSSPP